MKANPKARLRRLLRKRSSAGPEPFDAAGRPLRVTGVVTYMDESTLEQCLESLHHQTLPVGSIHVVEGVTPNSAAYNKALDLAMADKANVLLHTAADVIAEPDALSALLEGFDLEENYASVGSGFDVFHGPRAPVGLWALNLSVIGTRFRFEDVYKMDLRFCESIESATGTSRIKVDRKRNLGYHHPIWTPPEMYMKFRYVTQKYDREVKNRFRRFFERELAHNPDNLTLLIGQETLLENMETKHEFRSKDNSLLQEEFQAVAERYELTGKEFYVYHSRFLPLAQRLLGSDQTCVCIEDR